MEKAAPLKQPQQQTPKTRTHNKALAGWILANALFGGAGILASFVDHLRVFGEEELLSFLVVA